MQLTFFDCLLYPAQSNTKDLENMAFFGVSAALIAARLDEREATSEHWERLYTVEAERVSRAGLTPIVMLGLPAEAAPKHNFRELLFQLDALLSDKKARAIGPLSLGNLPRHQEALITQMGLAQKHSLPCLVALPARGKLPYIDAIMAYAKQAGLPSQRIAFLHSTGKSVVRARAAGAYSVLTVHPAHLKTKAAVALIKRQGASRIMLASGLGLGPSDVLSLPKVALALSKEKLSSDEISQVTQQNASQFLHPPQPQE